MLTNEVPVRNTVAIDEDKELSACNAGCLIQNLVFSKTYIRLGNVKDVQVGKARPKVLNSDLILGRIVVFSYDNFEVRIALLGETGDD